MHDFLREEDPDTNTPFCSAVTDTIQVVFLVTDAETVDQKRPPSTGDIVQRSSETTWLQK